MIRSEALLRLSSHWEGIVIVVLTASERSRCDGGSMGTSGVPALYVYSSKGDGQCGT
jgi:hypothetical protein